MLWHTWPTDPGRNSEILDEKGIILAKAPDNETAEQIVREHNWIAKLRVIARPIVDIETARGRAGLFELFDEIRLAE